jgi:hypothetical protein
MAISTRAKEPEELKKLKTRALTLEKTLNKNREQQEKEENKEKYYSLKKQILNDTQLRNDILLKINSLEQTNIEEKAIHLKKEWNTCKKRTSEFCNSVLKECDELAEKKSILVSEYKLIPVDTNYKNFIADATSSLSEIPITSSLLGQQAVFFKRYNQEKKELIIMQKKYEIFNDLIEQLRSEVSPFVDRINNPRL